MKKINTYWQENDRTVIATDDFNGIIEIEYPAKARDIGYIWHLWVNSPYRKQGYATALLREAENEISKRGRKYAELDWNAGDTPIAILRWYERQGYQEAGRGKHTVRLREKL